MLVAVPRRAVRLDLRPPTRRRSEISRQRLDRDGQPQRRGRGPGHREPPDARGHGLHAPRPGPAHRRTPHRDGTASGAASTTCLTRILLKPNHIVGGYAQLAYFFNYIGPIGQQPRRSHDDPQADRTGRVLSRGGVRTDMRVMAQMAMVMNLDKCIGCHTCSVTCKQAWTNRTGTEYVWFNNVETRPGLGYPRTYEDQDEWQGGWVRKPNGRLALRAGGRVKKLLSIFSNPKLPVDPRLLRAVDLRLRDADRRSATDRHLPGRPAQEPDLRQGHERRVVGQLGRRPRRLPGACRPRRRCSRASRTR